MLLAKNPKKQSEIFHRDLRCVIMPLRYWPVLKEVGRPTSVAEIPRAMHWVLSL